MGNKSSSQKSIPSNNSNSKVSSSALKSINCFKGQQQTPSVEKKDIPSSSTRKVDKDFLPDITDSAMDTPPKPTTNYFPSDVLKWMKQNANPRQAFKLMQVCKYFQQKRFPCRTLKGLTKNKSGNWDYAYPGNNSFCSTKTLDIFQDYSLWITTYFYLHSAVDPFSAILSKIAVCHATQVSLDSQNLTLNEFKILNSRNSFVKVSFSNTTITKKNFEVAALEHILSLLSNVQNLMFKTIVPSFYSQTDAAIINVPKLKSLDLVETPNDFNMYTFNRFKAGHPSVRCHITYSHDAQKTTYVPPPFERNSYTHPISH